MDRSALAPAALRLLTGMARQKQSRKPSFRTADLRRRQKTTATRRRRNRFLAKMLRFAAAAFLVSIVSTSIFLLHSYRAYARLIDERLAHGYLTSRTGIYAAPRTLRV